MWKIQLTSDIESGAGIQLSSPEPGRVTFMAPWDSSPRPMWFHFRLSGARGRRVCFELLNACQCLGGAPRFYREKRLVPVVTEDPPDLSPAHRRWRRVPRRDLAFDEKTQCYRFTVRPRGDTLYVAHCYPYGLTEWNAFVARARRSPHIVVGTLCRSAAGRPVPEIRITEGASRNKKMTWLFARNHAGEVSGSWALEGTLRWLFSKDPSARALRRSSANCSALLECAKLARCPMGRLTAPDDPALRRLSPLPEDSIAGCRTPDL